MKQTPIEKRILEHFEPGIISKDGFLGADKRHIHDIILADQFTLSRLKITKEDIAERLQYFINEGKKAIENEVEIEQFSIRVNWSKGMLPCPFNEPGLHHKIIATVYNKHLHKEIRFSQLNVHLIREHGFFEGEGSMFRLDPAAIIKILNVEKIRE